MLNDPKVLMSLSVFEYSDYKEFTTKWIEQSPKQGRGVRSQIAEAVGCQTAYVSHVLAADRHFSLEQAEALTRYMKLRDDEAEFFALLVEFSRAGTVHLKKFIQRQLEERKKIQLDLRNRVSSKSRIDEKAQTKYYSSWQYQAVRMLLTIPGHSTAKQIAQRLNLPTERVNEVLRFLLESGLAKETDDGYHSSQIDHHLGKDSVHITRLHSNWRLHTIQNLDRSNTEDLHYSAAVSLSQQDFQKVREIIIKSLNEAHKVIRPSREERLCLLAMDFYEI